MKREGAEESLLAKKKGEWNKLVRVHNRVRVQEQALQKKLEEAKNNAAFSKNPFKFIKDEVTQGKSEIITPSCDLQEAERFFKERYTDDKRTEKVDFPNFLDPPEYPKHQLYAAAPTKHEFESYLKSRRNKSSPGPDGIPYTIYKKCPKVRGFLIQLLMKLWIEAVIPEYDRQAVKLLLPKTTSRDLKDFRDITLFNTSLKTLTGVWGRKVTNFMTKNNYMDTSIQKGFVPKVSGCVEHNQTLTDMMKSRKGKEEFHLSFLDLENAFGSAKHNFILAALRWYNVNPHYIKLIGRLYNQCYVVVKTELWTTSPILIEKGSLQGGPEAGVLFNIPWNVILTALECFMDKMGYDKSQKPLSAFADDLTMMTKSHEHLQLSISYAQKLCEWSQCLRFKDSKSAVMSFNAKGTPIDPGFKLNGKRIPSLNKKPFKLLGKWIYPSLNDL